MYIHTYVHKYAIHTCTHTCNHTCRQIEKGHFAYFVMLRDGLQILLLILREFKRIN